MTNTIDRIIESWACTDSKQNSTGQLLEWIEERNKTVKVDIKKVAPTKSDVWQYRAEDGCIANSDRSFFTIHGFRRGEIEQPIIIQDEIGYLGILCKEISGVLHFLMQAKIEPGNINKIQISPTIQATKSNFMQKHGGNRPAYLDYFLESSKYEVIVDQIQSEQSSRFLGKRNRNIIIIVPPETSVEMTPNHRWMTLGQIKQLMKYDNVVNMDTRTVLSCIPFHLAKPETAQVFFNNLALYRSICFGDGINHMPEIYQQINNSRMFDEERPQLVPLQSMANWRWDGGEFVCKDGYHFKIVFCDIEIEGREVKRWTQPLFQAVGIATFGLLCFESNGVLEFLVKARDEIGSFDGPELGATLQLEADQIASDEIEKFFMKQYDECNGIMHDVILSEEGGRFYHEQNRNIVLKVLEEQLPELPRGYFAVDYKTLNMLVQINNCLNIQLRNLLSLLEV
ncbi:MAG: NDP-hexose 2,3-dehydratase family protein [Hydrogenoanaerobacterium sp.]